MAFNIKKLTDGFLSGNTDDVVDIVTFVESPWGLNFKLLPVQRFILKCYYNIPLDTKDKLIEVPDVVNERILYRFTEREFLDFLYEEGRCNTKDVEGKNFYELVLVIGRRGSKSTLAACISDYEMYKLVKRGDPSRFYTMPPDRKIAILNVAPTDDQALIVFDMIKAQANNCVYLRDRIVNSTQTYFNLQTDSDIAKSLKKKQASVVALTGGCSANALRGHNSIVVIMDEMAFFISNDGRFSGSEVYKALTPSTADFGKDGKVICISSPYAKYGSFWDKYTQSFDETESTLMFKMYSSMINTRIDSSYLKAKRRQDRTGFGCEFGAEFSDSVIAWIDDEEEFRRCVVDKPMPNRGVPGTTYYMGIDVGLKNDGTAVAIVHREGNKFICDYVDIWFSGSSDIWDQEKSIYRHCHKYASNDILKMSDITAEIKLLCRNFSIKAGVFDQHMGYALLERLFDAGLKQFSTEHYTDTKNSEAYSLAKVLYVEKLLELPDHPILIPELLQLEGEKKTKNKIIVEAPNKRGAHDDLGDALVRAIWMCHTNTKERPRNITSLAGPGGGIAGGQGRTQQSYLTYQLDKQRKHGEHPRLNTSRHRTLPGAVRGHR